MRPRCAKRLLRAALSATWIEITPSIDRQHVHVDVPNTQSFDRQTDFRGPGGLAYHASRPAAMSLKMHGASVMVVVPDSPLGSPAGDQIKTNEISVSRSPVCCSDPHAAEHRQMNVVCVVHGTVMRP